MVLGADLKPVKTKEINSLVEMGKDRRLDKVFNTVGNEETHLEALPKKSEPKIDLEKLAKIGLKSAQMSEMGENLSFATDISAFEDEETLPIAQTYSEFKKCYDLI